MDFSQTETYPDFEASDHSAMTVALLYVGKRWCEAGLTAQMHLLTDQMAHPMSAFHSLADQRFSGDRGGSVRHKLQKTPIVAVQRCSQFLGRDPADTLLAILHSRKVRNSNPAALGEIGESQFRIVAIDLKCWPGCHGLRYLLEPIRFLNGNNVVAGLCDFDILERLLE